MGDFRERPLTQYVLHVDGASRGNPGPGAAAAVVRDGAGRTLLEKAYYLGDTTNNVAEYTGLVRGLELVKDLSAGKDGKAGSRVEVVVRSDSELMVRQMTGVYRVKDAKLKPLAGQARMLAAAVGKVTFEHVPRDQNREADALANRAMDEGCDV